MDPCTMDAHAQQDQSKEIHPQPSRRRVIVFDIDNTLCEQARKYGSEPFLKDNYPDCPVIVWKNQDIYLDRSEHEHIFLPHLHILFDYLLKHEARVAFFSGGPKERNESVIPELLTSFYGSEKYEALRAKGQFNIHSQNDLRKTDYKTKGKREGNYVKDLKTVIRDGESLSDIILVDDDYSFGAYDQRPVMISVDLQWSSLRNSEEYVYENAKNSVYYMLGLFKTTFEDEKYKELALKDAFRQILPEDYYYPAKETDSFKRNMIDIGLSEVQKQLPDAKLFGSTTMDVRDYSE